MEADHHVATNKGAAQVLISNYRVPVSKVTAILHPYDEEDLAVAAKCASPRNEKNDSGPCRVGFLGTLFKPPRVPGAEIVQALATVRRNGFPVELHVVGDTGAKGEEVSAFPPDLLFMHARLPHAQALVQVASYDILLLALADLPNSRVVFSIKLPQYFLLNRPILAIVPEDSTVAELIRRSGRGIAISPGPNLAEKLFEALTRLTSGASVFVSPVVKGPEWLNAGNLANQWMNVILADAPPTLEKTA